MLDFLATATIENKPRDWMPDEQGRRRSLARHGLWPNQEDHHVYAYNRRWDGVCLVVVMSRSPFVVSVMTRAKWRTRRRRFLARVHGERSFNTEA
jgi:hypothetical protein